MHMPQVGMRYNRCNNMVSFVKYFFGKVHFTPLDFRIIMARWFLVLFVLMFVRVFYLIFTSSFKVVVNVRKNFIYIFKSRIFYARTFLQKLYTHVCIIQIFVLKIHDVCNATQSALGTVYHKYFYIILSVIHITTFSHPSHQ